MLAFEEKGHFVEQISDGDRFDVGHFGGSGVVGREGQELFVGWFEVTSGQLVPGGVVDALGVALCRGEEVDHEKVDALMDQVRGLSHEGSKFGVASFVSGRNDLDDRDDSPVTMTDRDAIGLAGVEAVFVTLDELRSGWEGGYSDPSRFCVESVFTSSRES